MSRFLLAVSVVLFTLVGGVGIASADTNGSATAHVYLNVDPTIAVGAIDSNVTGRPLQVGDREIPITFRIDANTEAVKMSVLVTKLYKGDDPKNEDVEPIEPNEDAGVRIEPENANPINGGSDVAQYDSDSSVSNTKGTFVGRLTEEITFESSQNGHFSQNVEVTPTWTNDDPEKPQGQYSGYVVLYSSVVTSLPPQNSTQA